MYQKTTAVNVTTTPGLVLQSSIQRVLCLLPIAYLVVSSEPLPPPPTRPRPICVLTFSFSQHRQKQINENENRQRQTEKHAR